MRANNFEAVDIGAHSKKDEQALKRNRTFRCRRDHPHKGEVHLEISALKTVPAFALTLPSHDRRALEDEPPFRALRDEQLALLIALFEAVSPRLVMKVLAEPERESLL